MNRFNSLTTAACVALAALALQHLAVAQGPELATAKVNHLGVVVPDIDKAIREYVRVMGFPTPTISEYPLPTPDGRQAGIKLATLYMPNFHIELNQPTNQVGPHHDHLQAHGMSIMHLGMALPGTGDVDSVRSRLEQQGGIWTLGTKGTNYAYLNFHKTLGTTFEIVRGPGPPGKPAPAVPTGNVLPPLAALSVGHVGFAVTSAAAVAESYAKTFGTQAPKVMEYKDAQYPPDAKWSPTAFLRLAFWTQGGMGLEIIESVGGPTPWSEYVEGHKGSAAQHLAINVGNRMDEMIKDLVAKGGKWTNGKPGGGYAYLDFSDTLGLIFELNGTSNTAPAK
jgi:catechol 2,3-dioxygenase-like lactoylglutathione lyase family enzyme